MKAIRILFSVFFFSVLISNSGCKKDENKCEIVDCGIGYCLDGTCQCPTGFFGTQCLYNYTPNTVLVEKVEVIRFPREKVDNTVWDSLSNPDLHLTIYQSFNKIWTSNSSIQNADSSTTHIFELTPAARLEDLDLRYTISLYDDDGNKTDEFMGGALFYPYNDENKLVTTKIVDNDGFVAFKLYLKYEF
jgi:hypothetical protein